jgi:ABC-type multidrug transport system ATPase subunit
MSNGTAVCLDRVTKRYAGHTAVRDLSLAVPRGSIYGLLGPNGAGKTTTIRMLMNVTIPDEGSIEILGEPARRELSHRVGYLPEERGLYKKMRVLDVLVFLAETKGGPTPGGTRVRGLLSWDSATGNRRKWMTFPRACSRRCSLCLRSYIVPNSSCSMSLFRGLIPSTARF